MPVTKDHPATADFPDEWRYVSLPLTLPSAESVELIK
jgi:hypothetical protein